MQCAANHACYFVMISGHDETCYNPSNLQYPWLLDLVLFVFVLMPVSSGQRPRLLRPVPLGVVSSLDLVSPPSRAILP